MRANFKRRREEEKTHSHSSDVITPNESVEVLAHPLRRLFMNSILLRRRGGLIKRSDGYHSTI